MTFLSAIRSSLDSTDPLADAMADYERARALGREELRASHVDDWAALWESGIEVDRSRRDVAVALNASLYYLLSSVRADYPHGLSPGGRLPFPRPSLAVARLLACSSTFTGSARERSLT